MDEVQGSKWDGMKRYAILGLRLAGTGIVIIFWLGLQHGMVIISILAPLFSQFEP